MDHQHELTRIRTDQVGSLLRPPHVRQAREAYRAGTLPLEALREVEDAAVLDALRMQQGTGIDIYTDGEFRREAWQTNFSEAVDGFVDHSRLVEWHDAAGQVVLERSLSKAVGTRLRVRRRISETDAAFLKNHAPGPFKITLPSPVVVATGGFVPGLTDGSYPDRASLLADAVTIVRDEMNALVGQDTSYLQLDEGFTGFVGTEWRARVEAEGGSAEATLAQAIAAENACFDSLPREQVTLAIHICRGNKRSRWIDQGSYDALAEHVFGELHADRFLLEYDSERAGGFEPLRFVPKDKTVVLGLVSSKTPRLERQDALLRRIDEATKFIRLEQLALSPQCGFASTIDGNLLTPDDQRRKLELVVDTARKVWGARS